MVTIFVTNFHKKFLNKVLILTQQRPEKFNARIFRVFHRYKHSNVKSIFQKFDPKRNLNYMWLS